MRSRAVHVRGSRHARARASVSYSPIVSHISESLSGVPTIRAFDMSARMVAANDGLMDANHRIFLTQVGRRFV